MKDRKKWFIISLLIYIIPIAVSIYYYPKLPNTIPTHFNSQGVADRFSSKFFGLFGIIGIMLAVQIFSYFITAKDPRRKYQGEKIIIIVMMMVPIITLIAIIHIVRYSLGNTTNVISYINMLFGFIFVLIGNYLPKTKRNYSIGIKLPWTMHNDEVWDKTHSLAGKLWVLGGILIAISSIASSKSEYILFGVILIITIIPAIYSYVIYKKIENEL